MLEEKGGLDREQEEDAQTEAEEDETDEEEEEEGVARGAEEDRWANKLTRLFAVALALAVRVGSVAT